MKKTIISIQYLRAVAALMVVLHHSLLQLERHGSGELVLNFHTGRTGVDLFFVISGFIIFYISSNSNKKVTSFWVDRIIRVVPLYWFYTMSMLMITILLPDVLKTAVYDTEHVIKSFLFIPTHHPKMENMIWPLLVQGWTLNYEMFFYAVFGLILFIKSDIKVRLSILICIFLTLIIIGIISKPTSPIIKTFTDDILLEFLIGAFIGFMFVNGKLLNAGLATAVLFVGMLGLVYSATHPNFIGYMSLEWGVPYGLIMLSVLSFENKFKLPTSNVFLLLGNSSYSLYLVHTFILGVVGFVWSKLNVNSIFSDVTILVSAIIISAIGGIVSYKLIEVPLTQFLKKRKALILKTNEEALAKV